MGLDKIEIEKHLIENEILKNQIKNTCTNTSILQLGDPTWKTQCEFNNLFGSSGRATGGNVTDAGSETVNVAAGTGFIKATDSDTAELLSFDWAAVNGIAIPTNTVRYIMVKYGTPPTAQIATLETDWDLDTSWPLAKVVNEAGVLHILYNPWWVTDGTTNIIQRIEAEGIVVRDKHFGGLAFGVNASRQVSVTAGKLWSRLNEFPIAAFTAGSTFELYWRSGASAWTQVDLAILPITQWNQLSTNTLETIGNNKYFNYWCYSEADDQEISLVYPQNTYNSSAEAEAESPPASIPAHLSESAILIGRVIFKQGTATPILVQSAFTQTFTASQAAYHGNLAGLSDDDHTQYLLASGTRAMTGNLAMGGFDITNAGAISASGTISVQNTITSIDSYLTLDTLDLNGGAFLSSVDWGSADVTTTGVITVPTLQKSGTTSVLDIQPDAVGSGWVSGTNYQSGPGVIFFKNATTYSGTHTTSQATVNENPWIEFWGSTSSGEKYATIGINDYNEVRHGGTIGRSWFVNGLGFETEMQVGSNVAFGIYKNTIQGSSRQIAILYVNDAGNTDPTTIFSTYTRRALNFGMTDSSQPKTWFHDGSATNTHMIGIWHDGTDGVIEARYGTIKLNSDTTIADGKNIILNTTNGTKIGTTTSQKLGFFNATPVVQQTGYAVPTDLPTCISALTTLRTSLNNLGLTTVV